MGGVRKSGAAPDTSCGEGAAPHLQAGWHQPISWFQMEGFPSRSFVTFPETLPWEV